METDRDAISGKLPHYLIAQTKAGRWAGYELTGEGYRRLTLAYNTHADAAEALSNKLRTPEFRE